MVKSFKETDSNPLEMAKILTDDVKKVWEFLEKIIKSITSMVHSIGRNQKYVPMVQINVAELAGLVDEYIRVKLFIDDIDNNDFDPFKDENWRILLMSKNNIINHVIKNISKKIYEMQTNFKIYEAEVRKIYFSQLENLKVRENYSIEVFKAIYESLPYPSRSGGLEKEFIETVDL